MPSLEDCFDDDANEWLRYVSMTPSPAWDDRPLLVAAAYVLARQRYWLQRYGKLDNSYLWARLKTVGINLED